MDKLIISTLPDGDESVQELLEKIKDNGKKANLIEASRLKISHCIGCNDCWIKTPGICSIKDDYELIFISLLQAKTVIFVGKTGLGFIDSKTKNLFDRILPLATMHLKYKNGQMRHFSRYGVAPNMALLYQGEANEDYLNHWLYRTVINLHGKSLGAFPMLKKEELYNALGCN